MEDGLSIVLRRNCLKAGDTHVIMMGNLGMKGAYIDRVGLKWLIYLVAEIVKDITSIVRV